MSNKITFNEILESADKLSVEEQETLIDILNNRLREHHRNELLKEIHQAKEEFKLGKSKPMQVSEIMKEIS